MYAALFLISFKPVTCGIAAAFMFQIAVLIFKRRANFKFTRYVCWQLLFCVVAAFVSWACFIAALFTLTMGSIYEWLWFPVAMVAMFYAGEWGARLTKLATIKS